MHTDPMRYVSRALAAACLLALSLLVVSTAFAGKGTPNKLKDIYPAAKYPGEQHLHLKFGPVHINPGQNTISFQGIRADGMPSVPGYITSFKPNLTYTDGTVPGVDVLHLHHGVWLVNGNPQWATGEEKTIADVPHGFGWRFTPGQHWLMNHMIHDLVPNPATVYITYDITFVPDTNPAAASIKTIRTQWMDVSGLRAYPVFDAKRSWGHKGTFTFPDQARAAAARAAIGPAHQYVVPHDLTLISTGGHLHPGGLHTDLKVTRGSRTVELFRSVAKYFEPAGAVSWDVAMTVSRPTWRVQLKTGDVLSVSGTYDTHRASWYEAMAIMPSTIYDGTGVGGVDPFVKRPNIHGLLTHGHLAENNGHGGSNAGLPDARDMMNGRSAGGPITINDFLYGKGDLNAGGRIPTVKRGKSITFENLDNAKTIWHTITSCKAPCNKTTGIAYPLANGKVQFDSGELGTGSTYFSPVSNKVTWQTPKNIPTGTYTYFCRVHPFMRGAFRVVR